MFMHVKVLAGLLLAVHSVATFAQLNKPILIEESQVWGSAIADYNGDGHDDIFITGHDGSNDRIWYWTPTGYQPAAQTLPKLDRHDCAAADVNRDGLMDFFCAVGADRGTSTGINEMWIQQPDGSFVKGTMPGAEDPYGRGRLPQFFDLNNDGWPDLFLTNYSVPRDDGMPNINRVFLNDGGRAFVEVTTAATGPHGSACVAKADLNRDGWDDLVLCSLPDLAHVYINNRQNDFIDVPFPSAKRWREARVADLNGDGWIDVALIDTNNSFEIWTSSGNGQYFDTLNYREQLGAFGHNLAIGDFNKDGRPDIYVVLRDDDCETTLQDLAADRIYYGKKDGKGWRQKTLKQSFAGCGNLVDVVDGIKPLVMNGGDNWSGPNYLLVWDPLDR